MINPDDGYILAGAVLVALLLGYLIAHIVGRRLLATANAEQSALAALNDSLQQQQFSLQQETIQLRERLNQAELDRSRLAAELAAQQDRRQELAVAFDKLQQRCDTAEVAGQQAHTLSQTVATELSESRRQVTELQARLQQAEQQVTDAREQLNQQHQMRTELAKQARSAEVRVEELVTKNTEQKAAIEQLQSRLDALQERYSALLGEHTELRTSLAERDASHTRQLALFEEQKQALGEQFKLLANDILEAKTKTLQESSQLSLTAVMNPFRESIEGFKKEVQDIHHRETTQQGELRKELETLKQLNQQITTEAHELSTALRGQKKLQGNWGELVLENVLDRSGLQLGKDYQREVSITTDDGRLRPDAVVYLPQGKHLIIDAKVSLNAYTRYVNSEDEQERKLALAEHVRAMGNRIRELADKDYYKLPGLNSPDMVFMFVPIESAFVEALKADETLFQSAIENNVLVATPTTLLTSLNIVRQLWRYEDQNKHTAALAEKAEGVFKKLNSFLASFEAVKKALDKASEAYVKAEGQLISGKGNLVKQVGEFRNLAPAIKAELPAYFTERANLEIDYLPAEEQAGDRPE